MIVRNRIWEELRQAKANIICIQRYTDRNRKISRYFNGGIILLAAAGALGGAYEQWIAVIASGLVAVSTILKSLLPNFIQSEQELTELDRLMDYYSKYLNKIEKIWYNYENKCIEEQDAVNQFFETKDDEADKYSSMNKLVRSIPDKENDEINALAKEYVNRVYFDYRDTQTESITNNENN